MTQRLKILVASLNWGIGHSSRMIPLIHALLRAGSEIMLASKGKAGELLKTEFPDLPFYEMPSLTIRYSRKKSQAFILILQIPRMLAVLFMEHRWLKKFISAHPVDMVISDNCYGLFNAKILSVIVTHQVSPILPRGLKWMEPVVHAWLGFCLRSFDRCWIPDVKDPSLNLTGCLSHRYPVLPNTKFMGILSRFCTIPEETEKENIPGRKVDILVILSGPEPQRTLMEEILVRQLGETGNTAAVVCGMQQSCMKKQTDSHASVNFYYHLPKDQFREIMRNAGVIICRSGYSTIMDLAELGLSAILVPTPGQPEQEYLAGFLSQQGFFQSMDQHNFNLQSALLRFHAQQKKTPQAFGTHTENYLNDLLALYEKKKIRHGQSRKESRQNLQN